MWRTTSALVLASAMVAGPAFADPWSDEASGLSFTAPAGWAVARAPTTNVTYVRASGGTGAAVQECHFLAKPRAATADASAYRVRIASREPVADSVWAGMTTAIRPVFAGTNGAHVTERRLDETSFWPIQFGRYESDSRIVHAAVQFRPGMEYWAFCFARTGPDQPAAAEAVLRSVASTRDAELRAAVEAELQLADNLRERRVDQMEQIQDDQERMRQQMNNLPSNTLPPPPTGGN